MDAPSNAGLSTCCTTPSTKERKLAVAKPKLTTANSPNEHEDEVVNIGEYNIDAGEWVQVEPKIASILDPENIDDDTTSMMTDVVKPSTEMVAEDFGSRNLTPEPVERVSRLGGGE